MASDMFLYWGSGSPPCWQVMIVLEEKGLQGYGQKLLSFSNKEHKAADILQLNPRGELPVFRHGDVVINESMSTSEYLESVFPNQGTKLIPDDQASKARVLQYMHEAVNLQKNAGELMRYFFLTKKEDQDPEQVKLKKEAFLKETEYWEAHFKKVGDGSFVAGKEFSMADTVLFPRLAIFYRMGLAPTRFPSLAAYYEMVSKRPSVQATWPPHWKESTGPTLLSEI